MTQEGPIAVSLRAFTGNSETWSFFLQSMWYADAAPGTAAAILLPCGQAA